MTLHDNYDALGYDAAAGRDARYTRYISEREVLRSHTSALIPARYGHWMQMSTTSCSSVRASSTAAMRSTALHTGTPHQLDLWRVGDRQLDSGDLKEMVEIVVRAGVARRRVPRRPARTSVHHRGLQIDVQNGDTWVEVGEARRRARARRCRCSWHRAGHGLGLDRILMLRKGIADIRLLGADDPRIAGQMRDLGLYRPVSNRPAVTRDLSIAVPRSGAAEELGERVRAALRRRCERSRSGRDPLRDPRDQLPEIARTRLGLRPGQKNVLVRVVLRHPSRTLTREEGMSAGNRIYGALHCGLTGPPCIRVP